MDTHPKHDIALGAVRYQPSPSGESAPAAAPTVAQWPTRGASAQPPETPAAQVPPETTAEQTIAEPATETRPGPPVWEPSDRQSSGVVDDSGRIAKDPSGRRPNRTVVIGAGVVVGLLLVGASAVALLNRDGGEPSGSPEPSPTATTPTATTPSAERVYDEDVLMVPFGDATGTHYELRALTVDGTDLGPVSDLEESADAPWVSRDGRFVGFRTTEAGQDARGPGTIMVMGADREPVPLFTTPPEGVLCTRRVAWHPNGRQVLLGCFEDKDGDGVRDSEVVTLYAGPVDDAGQVDGNRFERVLGASDPTLTSPGGSPGSTLGALSFLPSGAIAIAYEGGEEPGVHVFGRDGIGRLTSGELDQNAVASPTPGLVVFTRDGDLYLASTNQRPPPCPAPREASVDPVTDAPLCNLTGDLTNVDEPAWEPTWSWDGTEIAFLIETAPRVRTLWILDLEDPDSLRSLIGEPAAVGSPAVGSPLTRSRVRTS